METRILVIESNPDLRKLFEHLISADGYLVDTCPDWHAADDYLKQGLPNLIIYDWEMGNLAGYMWSEALRTASATAKVPVLFVSDSPPSRQILERLTAADIALIDKPFDIFVFRRRVDALLGIRERALGV
jgi:DNA-binding response OmpR family regulator